MNFLWKLLNLMPNPDVLLPWDSTDNCHHNVRALCDLCGLTWKEKLEMTAVVWGESEFIVDAICLNLSDGTFRSTRYGIMNTEIQALNTQGLKVSSIDAGLCQWNSKFHGNEITTDQAVHNPEMAVRLMCKYWIEARTSPAIKDEWISHKSGRYLQMLGKV